MSDEGESSDNIAHEEVDIDIEQLQRDEYLQQAIKQGVNLREYSRQIQDDLRRVEIASIDDYVRENENLALLHSQLNQCDTVLEKMEIMLSKFQGSLGDISDEIRQLQEQSFTMNIKLRNRKNVEAPLSELIDKIALSPELIQKICLGDIDNPTTTAAAAAAFNPDAYMEYLVELNRKADFVSQLDQQQQQQQQASNSPSTPVAGSLFANAGSVLATADVRPTLDKLCTKAVSTVREFLLQKIAQLKKPKTNIQILQKNVLLRYKSFNTFLQRHNPEVAREVSYSYMDTVRQLYFGHFKQYIVSLLKLVQLNPQIGSENPNAVNEPLIVPPSLANPPSLFGTGSGSGAGSGITSLFSSLFSSSSSSAAAASAANASNVTYGRRYVVGNRISVVEESTAPALIPHVILSQNKDKRFPFEVIFRSISVLLMDTATSEYLFLMDFFGPPQTPVPTAASTTTATPSSNVTAIATVEAMFREIFGRVIKLVQDTVDQQLKMATIGVASPSRASSASAAAAAQANCIDAVGLLLMIRVNQMCQLIMSRRRIPCLDAYFDAMNMLLWPRYKLVLDSNTQSLRDAVKEATATVTATEAALSTPNRNLDYSKAVTVAPARKQRLLDILQRYADFVSSIHTILSSSSSSTTAVASADTVDTATARTVAAATVLMNLYGGGEDVLRNNLMMLQNEVKKLIHAESQVQQQLQKVLQQQQRQATAVGTSTSVFFINCFDAILTALSDNGTLDRNELSRSTEQSKSTGSVVQQLATEFHDLMEIHIGLYIEEELRSTPTMARMVAFIKTAEQATSPTAQQQQQNRTVDASEVESIAKEFNGTWQDALDKFNTDVTDDFTKRIGVDILKKLMTQFILYYSRFSNIANTVASSPHLRTVLVPNQVILYKMKKFSGEGQSS